MPTYALPPYELFAFSTRAPEFRPADGYQPPAWYEYAEPREHHHREHQHISEVGSLPGMTPSLLTAGTTSSILPADFTPGPGAASDLYWTAAERQPVPVPPGADNLRATRAIYDERVTTTLRRFGR